MYTSGKNSIVPSQFLQIEIIKSQFSCSRSFDMEINFTTNSIHTFNNAESIKRQCDFYKSHFMF